MDQIVIRTTRATLTRTRAVDVLQDDTCGFDKETVAWFATGLGLGALGSVTALSFVLTSEALQKALPPKKD